MFIQVLCQSNRSTLNSHALKVDRKLLNRTYISCEIEELAVLVEAGGPLPAYDLEEQDPEAENVGFDGEETLGSVFRSDVATERAGRTN